MADTPVEKITYIMHTILLLKGESLAGCADIIDSINKSSHIAEAQLSFLFEIFVLIIGNISMGGTISQSDWENVDGRHFTTHIKMQTGH